MVAIHHKNNLENIVLAIKNELQYFLKSKGTCSFFLETSSV